MDWSKILVAVASALVVALQGVNITQGVAISGAEKRIENLEEDLGRANYELNKRIVANQEEFRTRWAATEKKLDDIWAKVNADSAR